MENGNQNKQVVAKWLDAVFNHPTRLTSLRELISDENPLSAELISDSWRYLHSQFKGVRAEILDQVAEEDRVITMMRVEGELQWPTAAGEKKKTWEAFFYHRVKQGQIVVSGPCASTLAPF